MAPNDQQSDRPYAFISYARDDQEYVSRLVDHLAAYYIDTWIDTDTNYGATWPRVIRDKIDACAAFVVVMTPRSEDSEWVGREVVRAQQRNKTILPLLLEGLPFFELNTTHHEDVTDGGMPHQDFLRRLGHLVSVGPPISPDNRTVPDEGNAGATAWTDEARRLAAMGRYEESLAAAERALAADPNAGDAQFAKGLALEQLGRNEDAVDAFQAAIRHNPTDPGPLLHTALVKAATGQLAEALDSVDAAIALTGPTTNVLETRGDILVKMGRHGEAVEAFDQAIDLDPDNGLAHFNRGLALNGLGRREEALDAFTRAAELGLPV